jgi:hypothetical protein
MCSSSRYSNSHNIKFLKAPVHVNKARCYVHVDTRVSEVWRCSLAEKRWSPCLSKDSNPKSRSSKDEGFSFYYLIITVFEASGSCVITQLLVAPSELVQQLRLHVTKVTYTFSKSDTPTHRSSHYCIYWVVIPPPRSVPLRSQSL